MSRSRSGVYAATISMRSGSSPMNSSSAPSNASVAIRSDSTSSSTRKAGSMPALSACARRMRAHRPWIVDTQALSAARASSRRPSSRKRRRTRLFISAAAFSVNVIASTWFTVDAVLDHRLDEALDQHGRLAGAGAGPHQQRAVAPLDCPALLRRQLPHRSLLHIDGYLQPPFQSHAVGAGPQLAGAHLRVGLADPAERPVELLLELVRRQAVRVEPAVAELVHVARHHAARARVPVAERHVDAAGRAQAEQLLHDEHVERGLEAVLRLPARDLVAVHALAGLVVDHERHAVALVDAVDPAAHAQAAVELDRLGLAHAEVALELDRLEPAVASRPRERRKRSRSNSSRRAAARTRVCFGESLEGRALVAQLLDQDPLGLGEVAVGHAAARRSPRASRS